MLLAAESYHVPEPSKVPPIASMFISTRRVSMSHGINDEVQRHADRVTGVLLGITIQIHEFPGIAEVRVVRDDDHQPPLVIEDAVNARPDVVRLLPGLSAETSGGFVRSLDDLVDIEERVKDRVIQRNLLNPILGKNLPQFGFYIFLLI